MHADRRVVRISSGMIAAASGAGLALSSMLGWITTPMASGGRTSISGWGSISGGADLVDGVNINTLMAGVDGAGTFRPGLLVAIDGAMLLIVGLILAAMSVRTADRRYRSSDRVGTRVVGVLLILGGVVGAGWAAWKLIDPGDALGVLPAGEAGIGVGPIVALICALLAAALGAAALGGLLDPPLVHPRRQRGVQP